MRKGIMCFIIDYGACLEEHFRRLDAPKLIGIVRDSDLN